MSTFSWRINKPHDEAEPLPACSSCRKRKLRCSREGPPCAHCSRLGIACAYDAKQKPGVKLGAVEALNRRVAFLEQILLDANDQPLVRFDKNGNVFGQNSHEPVSEEENHSDRQLHEPSDERLQWLPADGSASSARYHITEDEVNPQAALSLELQHRAVHGTADDEHDSSSDNNVSGNDLEELLPSVDILLAVVDYFCISFHHWIPFLHKARWRKQVEEQNLNSGDLLILHAAIAAVLPFLNTETSSLTTREAEVQSKISRTLVTKYAMSGISLQSLQALVILVFNDLNNGELSRSYALVGYLKRIIDYLQLSVEQDASHSKALMKPLKSLTPSTDWTELESRRRLFWCVFLLDRYTAAVTGLNTSFAAEDVSRRLPADGFYFTSERPVSCPFFGLWNKTYAKLDVPLTAHIPAQYNEGDRQTDAQSVSSFSPGASVSSGVDASRLGAFAYCIEATESLNQITTFFLQQCIDWQNRDDVMNWLTRFKELDLRLVRWKQLLPPRWKDSNISTDKSLIDMDPNLTLAHITHNTSMILLHYSIAWPPVEWTSLIKLPSVCSIETCHLAAIETSHIVGKFLQHTRIPFVNSHFSFCILVAAKLLLFFSQVTQQPVDEQFKLLVEALWTISARWGKKENTDAYKTGCRGGQNCDMAAYYAQFLEKLQVKCADSIEYRFDLLDHSCSRLGHTPRTPLNNIANNVQAHKRAMRRPSAVRDNNKRTRLSSFNQERSTMSNERDNNLVERRSSDYAETITNPYSVYPSQNSGSGTMPSRLRTETSTYTTEPQTNSLDGSSELMFVPSSNSLAQNADQMHEWAAQAQQSYFADDPSNLLMDPHFMEMDRVITFEDANFYALDFS